MADTVTFTPMRDDYVAADRLRNRRKDPSRRLLWLGVTAAILRLMHIVSSRALSSDERENLFAAATISGLRRR